MKTLIAVSAVMSLFLLASHAHGARVSVPLEGSPYCGPERAAVTIVEFLDYQ